MCVDLGIDPLQTDVGVIQFVVRSLEDGLQGDALQHDLVEADLEPLAQQLQHTVRRRRRARLMFEVLQLEPPVAENLFVVEVQVERQRLHVAEEVEVRATEGVRKLVLLPERQDSLELWNRKNTDVFLE